MYDVGCHRERYLQENHKCFESNYCLFYLIVVRSNSFLMLRDTFTI